MSRWAASGWRQNLVGQEEVEYLAGEEAVRIFERKIAMQTDRTIVIRSRQCIVQTRVFASRRATMA